MIKVYPSRLNDNGVETYKTRKSHSVLSWLRSHGISQDTDLAQLPISLFVNGTQVLPGQWGSVEFTPKCKVEIYREPEGTDPFSITFALIFGAKAVLSALVPKLPGVNSSNRGQGDPLDEATAKGNKIKINDIRPELAGYNPARYPDLLTLSRRYFASPREQRIEMLLGVGQGEYLIPEEGVKVGATPLLSLGPDASFAIYQPGQDLSADPAHYCWYTAPEVGASSNGSAGLELTVSTPYTSQAEASVFQFVGDTVSIPAGAGSFPSDWVNGMMLAIAAPYSYTIADGTGDAGRDIISGDISSLGLAVNDSIELAGDITGRFVVHSVTSGQLQLDYEGGAPANGLTIGNVVLAISFVGLRFRAVSVSAQAIQVQRIKSNGATDLSWPGWPSMSSNQGRVRIDASNYEGGYRGPFFACPEGEVVTVLEFDVFYPSGIVGLGAKGDRYNVTSTVQFEYREPGGAWNVIQRSASGSNLDSLGFTWRQDIGFPIRPEVRMKRLPKAGNTDEVQDTVMWLGMKALLVNSSPTVYPGMTTMSCNIRGGDRIASQTENMVSVECTRILPVLRNGQWFPKQPTREISAWIGHVVRSVGYSDTTDLDLAELWRLESSRWTPRGDTYDRIVNSADTVKGNLLECLQAGFSTLTIDRGVITAVRDEPRGPEFNHVYNPQNLLEPLEIEFEAPRQPDDFDGVDVEYFDHVTKQNETVQCRLTIAPGVFEPGTRVDKQKLPGVTDRTKAYQWGMRKRREQVYRKEFYTGKTELDALNSGYLDYVALGITTPGWGQSMFMTSFRREPTQDVIGTSEDIDFTSPEQYRAVIRRPDGTASGPYGVSGIDSRHFSILPLDFIPDLSGEIEAPIIQIGHVSTWVLPALITDVTPNGTRGATFKAVNYDERVYLSDDALPPS